MVSTTASADVWFIAGRDGKQQGPFSFAVVKTRAASGDLHPADLVWRAGMSAWVAASEFKTLAFIDNDRSSVSSGGNDATSSGKAPVDRMFARMETPEFFRNSAKFSALAAVALAITSVGGFAFGISWFTGALLCVILAVLGQGMAAILETLQQQTVH
jgi:hypothetical protein